jgi:hypothetical protein
MHERQSHDFSPDLLKEPLELCFIELDQLFSHPVAFQFSTAGQPLHCVGMNTEPSSDDLNAHQVFDIPQLGAVPN